MKIYVCKYLVSSAPPGLQGVGGGGGGGRLAKQDDVREIPQYTPIILEMLVCSVSVPFHYQLVFSIDINLIPPVVFLKVQEI